MHALPTTTPNTVAALDVPDDLRGGGACHHYGVRLPDGTLVQLQFQHGPRLDPASTLGLMEDDLLAVLEDRLAAFQSGPFACDENQEALASVRDARAHLNARVADRVARGVLGENKR